MTGLDVLRGLFAVGDRANAEVLAAARGLDDAALDRRFEMGPGTLRRTLLHITIGEEVWLERIRGNVECPWGDQGAAVSVASLGARQAAVIAGRDALLDGCGPDDLTRPQDYRDSKGGRFRASLGDMLTQLALHSVHHRAQAVNMLRQLAAPAADMDYMMHVRVAADTGAPR